MPGDITVSFDGLNNATINQASLQIDVSKDGAHIGCILGELGSWLVQKYKLSQNKLATFQYLNKVSCHLLTERAEVI